eukprot:5608096-Prymnesium_polylepis.1
MHQSERLCVIAVMRFLPTRATRATRSPWHAPPTRASARPHSRAPRVPRILGAQVRWMPEVGKNRITAMTQSRSD